MRPRRQNVPEMAVTWKLKVGLFLAYAVAYYIFYVIPNFHSIFQPVYLPLTAFELAIPFLPYTFWIYVSDYLLALFAIVTLKDADFFEFVRLAFAVLVVCGVIFTLYPTIYPRPEYPTDLDPLTQLLVNTIAKADMPTNCFPSMHCACTTAAAWCMRNQVKWKRVVMIVWSILIYVSTLTTKQHYLLDIIGGISVVAICGAVDRVFMAKVYPVLAKSR